MYCKKVWNNLQTIHLSTFTGCGSKNTSHKFVESRPSILIEPAGCWTALCDNEVVDSNGLTEKDRVWGAAKKLIEENFFIQASYVESSRDSSKVFLNFFVENYLDVEKVFQSAAELMKRSHYPAVLFLKTVKEFNEKEFNFRYLYCCDGDLYEWNTQMEKGKVRGYHLVKRSFSS